MIAGEESREATEEERVSIENPNWEDHSNNEHDVKEEENKTRRPKHKLALLMGFCGTGYHGMQMNPNVKTIEGELLQALVKSGVVESYNNDLQKIGFMRCARTDKGVHALGQLVSAKLMMPSDPDLSLSDAINAHLPEQIRVWGHVRVNRGFNAKNSCDSRIYEYLIPSYCFRPLSVEERESLVGRVLSEEEVQRIRDAYQIVQARQPSVKNGFERKNENDDADEDEETGNGDDQEEEIANTEGSYSTVSADEMAEIRKYRIDAARLEQLRNCLSTYVGTRNFHNYTIGNPFWNPSSKRIMRSFVASDPFEVGGMEWISLQVHGQSFMLHQIRKMVGMAVLVMRADVPATIIEESYKEYRLNIPKAPSLGLFLNRTVFESYNKHCTQLLQTQASFAGSQIDFEPYEAEMSAFREKFIYSKIVEEELNGAVFEEWFRFLASKSIEFAYLQPDGSIPDIYKEFATLGVYDRSRRTKTAMRVQKRKRKQ